MTWTHRPALDGLRTVAVYLVVLFHAEVALFPGGYLGVDLFFVLSGFLVAGLLLDELDRTGRIDLRRFYARRVRRLLPAALVVVVATAAVFVLVAPLARRLPLVGDAQASLLYYSNWRFTAQSADYFGPELDRSPYLHFWSLSIEEQFYIVFPLLLIGLFWLRRHSRRAVGIGVATLLVLSLLAQYYWAARDVDHAYYATEARAYQLLAGVLAALAFRSLNRPGETAGRPGGPGGGPGAATSNGAVLVAMLALLALATNAVQLHPSARGVTATVAATLVILGLVSAPEQRLARVLSHPSLTYLGRISYGTYLWHWPVILVLREILDVGPWTVAGLTTVIATGLAALSFEVLEHPIRTSRRLAPYRLSAVAVGVGASVLLALVVVPRMLESEDRPALVAAQPIVGTDLDADEPVPTGVDYAFYADDLGPDDTYCTADAPTSCVVHRGTSGLSVALVGDSHARMLAPTLERLAEEHDFTLSLSIVGGCPWQDGVRNIAQSENSQADCRDARRGFYEETLDSLDVDVALLSELPRDVDPWQLYLRPSSGSFPGLDPLNLRTIAGSLDTLGAAGVDTIIFDAMLRLPLTQQDPLECLSGATLLSQCRVATPLTAPPTDAFFDTFAAARDDVASITINDLMCPDAPVCAPMDGDVPIWRDNEHYTPSAIRLHQDAIWDRLVSTGFLDAAD